MSTEADLEDFEFSADDCLRWSNKLELLCKRFLENEDIDNARLMRICSTLVEKLGMDVEIQVSNPFPVKGGEC